MLQVAEYFRKVMRKVIPMAMAKPILPIMANGEVDQWPRPVLCNLQRSGHIAGGFLTDGRRCFRCPCSRKRGHSNSQTLEKKIDQYPIGSMYAIYGNMCHQYTPNVSIYTIHGSYGILSNPFYPNSLDICEKQKRVPKTCHVWFLKWSLLSLPSFTP